MRGMDLLKSEEVAELLKVSEATLARWRGNDQGPPFLKIEGTVRYDREAVIAWLNAQAA